MAKIPRVLIIAGSDSGGGAGIQGDAKTVTCLGGYAATAITALTAQNTKGVFGIHEVPVDFIKQQIELVLSDIGADAIKTGMLHCAEVIQTVAQILTPYLTSPGARGEIKGIPLIVDPVMVAKGGSPLLERNSVESLKLLLIPKAYLITPNIPEAEILSGMKIDTVEDMETAGKALLSLGCHAVLMKGGHLHGNQLTDLLITKDSVTPYYGERIQTTSTHGTGCTLASAIATGIARGMNLQDAVKQARNYVSMAIQTAPKLGSGHGPLNHGHTVKFSG
jgi:hydroxymethylpyrimidine/phosphomethylpyrimidine kinase